LNQIAARWPTQAVAQLSFSSNKKAMEIIPNI